MWFVWPVHSGIISQSNDLRVRSSWKPAILFVGNGFLVDASLEEGLSRCLMDYIQRGGVGVRSLYTASSEQCMHGNNVQQYDEQ